MNFTGKYLPISDISVQSKELVVARLLKELVVARLLKELVVARLLKELVVARLLNTRRQPKIFLI